MCDLQELQTIADTLQQLCARHYGPRCAATLLTSSTGKAVVTSDGLTILEAVSPSHPVANMIVAALKKCHLVTYDGSKTFLLYVKFFLKHLTTAINLGKFNHQGSYSHHTNSSCYKHSKICVARSINNVSDCILSEIYSKLTKSLEVKKYREGYIYDKLMKVCQGTLIPHFNQRQTESFSEILIKVVENSISDLSARETLQLSTTKFNQMCLKVPGRNYLDTTTLEPLLIKRSKQFKNFLKNVKDRPDCIKAICIQLSNENSDDEESDVGMIVKDKNYIYESLQLRRDKVNKFAVACSMFAISLIICCDSLPDYIISILHQHSLTVLTNVYKEDIDLLELFTHTTSITSFQDNIMEVNRISITAVEEFTIGNEQFLHVKSDQFSFKHVIVCAPSPGLCDQTALLLQKAMNAMYLSLENTPSECDLPTHFTKSAHNSSKDKVSSLKDTSNSKLIPSLITGNKNETESLFEANLTIGDLDQKTSLTVANLTIGVLDQDIECNVIPVGGAFELMMTELLIDQSKAVSDPHVKEICNILSKTLVNVLRTLHENRISATNGHGPRFIDVKLEMVDRMRKGQIGALNIHGKVCDSEEVLMEPLKVKTHVLHSVLNLMSQLVRVDDMIPVKKL